VDVFTKGLSSLRFNFLKGKLMVSSPPPKKKKSVLGGAVNQSAVTYSSIAHEDMVLHQEGNIPSDMLN
jgi:hypothetical protein